LGQDWVQIMGMILTGNAAVNPLFEVADAIRQAQGESLRILGFGPVESSYRVVASSPLWRLRRYSAPSGEPSVLIVAAPIKRPYIWDLAPSVSAVRTCLQQGLGVHLLEWKPPSRRGAICGLAEYAHDAISEAVAAVSEEVGSSKPFLMGHSLGGTLAAIFAALHPEDLSGLVLLSAPLCLHPGVSSFRDALVMMAPTLLSETDVVPGSFLSQLSAAASPTTFVWSRLLDAAASAADARASDLRPRIERWTLDEMPLSGKLVQEIFLWLYRENRLCRGTLAVRGRVIRPSRVQLPTLAVANAIDEVAPPASVMPFLEAMSAADTGLIEYPGEVGVVLQHLGILVGHDALARIWPQIVAWIRDHS
jgi:polyhydroxyalkanoate synthase